MKITIRDVVFENLLDDTYRWTANVFINDDAKSFRYVAPKAMSETEFYRFVISAVERDFINLPEL